jgi:hypothetical protein
VLPRPSGIHSQSSNSTASASAGTTDTNELARLPSAAPVQLRTPVSARIGALLALCGVTAAVAYGGYTAYACARDSFVVPTILSPSSEVVVATKLRLGELNVDRVRAFAELESVEADLAGSDKALARLQELKRTSGASVHWTSRMTSQRANDNVAELEALATQRQLLVDMVAAQKQLTDRAHRDAQAGLITGAEYSRQEQALSQMQLALLDNNRAMARGRSATEENNLAQQALSQQSAPQSPELVNRQEQLIRVDLEIVRLDSEKRAKIAQRDSLVERVAQIDEMVQQIEERPLFQAVEKDLELAFVPYTQLSGVAVGAEVYSCVWGLVWCEPVGRVAELVPGEVVQADPWGSATRGEYAVLDLHDHAAARAKTLRIRSWTHRPAAPAPAPENTQNQVSTR